jgi:hypothetical protein
MLIFVLGFGRIWSTRPGRNGKRAAHFNRTGILASGKYRHRSCVHGYIRINECTGFYPDQSNHRISRVFASEPPTIWKGSEKLFLREVLPKNTSPERYLTRMASNEVGWIDRSARWMCDGGEVISFSEGNEQQEALVLLPAFGWINAGGELFHLIPQERPSMASRA